MELQEHKRLIELLPEHLREYREYQVILGTEQKELDDIFLRIDHLLSNLFTDTAYLDGIERKEAMYGIVPAADAALEERRFTVKAKESSALPYTVRRFRSMLATMCGEDNFKIVLNPAAYALNVKVRVAAGTPDRDAFALLAAVDALTMQVKPCNLTYQSALFERHSGVHTTYSGAAVSVMKTYHVEVV